MAFKSKRMTHIDGKMHHLGTDEHDITPTVLLTADMEDAASIAALLSESRQTGLYREYVTYVGEADGVPLTVMSTGNGCMPMAIAVEELNHIGARTLIKVGSGAAIQPGVQPGSMLVAMGSVRGEGATLEYVNYQYPAVPDMELMELLADTAAALGEKPVAGIFRSHDAYYPESPCAPGGMEKIARWRSCGVQLLEHETSALFVLSSILKLRAAALYVAEENFTDGTALSPPEKQARLTAAYRVAIACARQVAEK